MSTTRQPHTVALVIYDEVAATDFFGPLEAFGLANYISGDRHYRTVTIAAEASPLRVAGGYCEVTPTHCFATADFPIGTLLISGGPAAKAASRDPDLLAFLRRIEPGCERFGSICNGAYVLAATGLVERERVTTHWLHAADLQSINPGIHVDAESVYVSSGKFWSSAGMTTGIDMALAIIEADHGRALALEVARHLVLPMKRAGGQSQFSMHLKAQFAETPSIERIQHYIIDNPAGDLSVAALAGLAAMSERTFLRQFKAASSKTLGDFIADTRLRHSCALLEQTSTELKSVASQSGLGSDANMRKIFMRRLGVTPSQYRERFTGIVAPSPYGRVVSPAQPKRWLHRSENSARRQRAKAG
jgi:transcriptional regulator GlxA family with amidase domain